MESGGGAAGASGDGDGFEQAGADEAGRVGVEVEECVGGLAVVDAALVAEADDRVGESCPLLWGVYLLGDSGERIPAPVGVRSLRAGVAGRD